MADADDATGTATITVRRRKERVALLRAYRVRVDGNEAGRLKPGGAVTVEVDRGSHAIECRLDWYLAGVDVVVEPGEHVAIQCSAVPNVLASGLYPFRRDWLRVEVLTASTRFTRRRPEPVAWPLVAQWAGYAAPVFVARLLYAFIRGGSAWTRSCMRPRSVSVSGWPRRTAAGGEPDGPKTAPDRRRAEVPV